MSVTPPVPARGERGFLLVGVVMFMIALTILGLSLFALSSYEAQFFYDSVSREQSLQSSESGMEMVKALLATPNARLESAQLAVGQFGITRALAYQQRSSDPNDTTSRGPVNWDSTLVIVVAARSGGEERMVQSRFIPVSFKNPYQQLLSAGGRILYNDENDSKGSMQLAGTVWQLIQSPSDSAWTGFVDWTDGRPIDPSAPAVPLGDLFVATHMDPGLPVAGFDNSSSTLTLANPTSQPMLFQSPPSPGNKNDPEYGEYSFYADQNVNVKVQGTVVWVVPQGVCFRRDFDVSSKDGNPATLVIVATANGRDSGHPNRGIWMEGGLENNDNRVSIFLVSQGDISVTHEHNASDSQPVHGVSIVAGGDIELGGPNAGNTFSLAYSGSMAAIASDLLARGALPTTSGGSGVSYAYARQSWLETTLP